MEENQINNDTQQENVEVEETEIPKNKFEVESYSKSSFNYVEKMRLRGKMFKVDIPYLDHTLTKPEKPRIMYRIVAIIIFVLAAAAIALGLFLAASTLPNLIGATGEVGSSSPNWDPLNIISGLGGAAIGLAIMLMIGVFILFATACAYLITTGLNCLNLATATKEEMAFGTKASQFTWSLIAAIIIGFVVGTFAIILSKGATLGIIVGCVLYAISVVLIVVFVRVIIDRVNCYKFTKTLDPAAYENTKAHFDAIKQAKRRKEYYSNHSTSIWR